MRITWSENEKRFEAQFSQGEQWQGDKDLAQAAGFRTDGPPAWVWYTYKAATLTKLKASVGALSVQPTISTTKEALGAYNRLRAIEERDAELKKFAKAEKKRQKREQERQQLNALHGEDEDFEPEYEPLHYTPIPEYWKGKDEITRDDLGADFLARFDKHESIPQRRAEPIGKCKICGDPTYDPEEIDLCLWDSGRGEEKFFEELFS